MISIYLIKCVFIVLCYMEFTEYSWVLLLIHQVALKTLIVIHRALREVDPTFREELINYGRSRSHMLNMAYFKDDSSAEGTRY
jgi:hypothetical protein